MSSLIQSVTRSFTGDVQLEDQPVAVSMGFSDGVLHLRLGGDTVGVWPTAEVEFVAIGDGLYELRADGDSIAFRPHQATAFAAFLRDHIDAPSEVEPPDAEPDSSLVPQTLTPEPDRDHRPVWSESVAASQPVSPAAWSPDLSTDPAPDISGAADEIEPVQGWSDPPLWGDPSPAPLGLADADDPEPLITWEPVPDESYAAGIDSGPAAGLSLPLAARADALSEDGGPAQFSTDTPRWHQPEAPTIETGVDSPVADVDRDALRWRADTEPARPIDHPSWSPLAEPTPADVPPIPAAIDQPEEEPARTTSAWDEPPALATTPDIQVEAAPVTGPVRDEVPAGPPEPPVEVEAPVKDYLLDEPGFATYADFESEPETEPTEEPTGAAAVADIPGDDTPATPSRRLSLGQFKMRLGERKAPEETGDKPAGSGFFQPETDDDDEAMRQWVIVVAGGLAIVVLLAIIVFGLSAAFSTDEPSETTVTTTAAEPAPPSTAVPVTTTTPAVSTGSSIIEPPSDFVSDWNALASTYAFNLAIEAEGTPVSAQAGPYIHVTYDAGNLTLDMSPQGNGNDRDLLIAMGMAVAYAEPSLGPEERKEVLSVLGIDVANPDLSQVGGEVTRGPVKYRATVVDGIIRLAITAPA